MRPLRKTLSLTAIAVLLAISNARVGTAAEGSALSATPATWPQWRGPTRDGRIVDQPAWPGSISGESLQQTWRVRLGPSYSGPVVSERYVFTTETVDQKREVVRALDRESGKQVWEAAWEGALSVPFFAKSNGDWIRATPALDGSSLFVAGMRDRLVCLDVQSGAIRWNVDFVKELKTPLPAFGFVSSPLVDGRFLYVQAGGACIKLDKENGKVLWRSLQDEGGMMGGAFSSPYLATLGDKPQLLVQTRDKLAGLDPETGAVYWSREIPAFRGMNILTPTVSGNSVFTSAYGGKSLLFRIGRQEQSWNADEAWQNKVTAYMSSPVIVGGNLYLHLRNQRFTCIDLESGQTRWTTKPFGKYWSLVAQNDKILALDERGELLLIQANPEKFELIDSRKISDDPSWAHLAVCGNEVFIRELNAMTAYRWQSIEAKEKAAP